MTSMRKNPPTKPALRYRPRNRKRRPRSLIAAMMPLAKPQARLAATPNHRKGPSCGSWAHLSPVCVVSATYAAKATNRRTRNQAQSAAPVLINPKTDLCASASSTAPCAYGDSEGCRDSASSMPAPQSAIPSQSPYESQCPHNSRSRRHRSLSLFAHPAACAQRSHQCTKRRALTG